VRTHVKGRAALGGVLIGSAVLLRPEALWFVVGIASGVWLLDERPGRAALVSGGVTALATISVSTLYAAIHFGSLVTPHISRNEAALSHGWFASRVWLMTTWFTPSFNYLDFWSVAPAAALAFLPIPRRAARAGRGFLLTTAIVCAVLVLATAPNDGGAQWGPRYLLFAYVPLTVLVADALAWMASDRRLVVLAAAIVVASLWTDRAAYNNLRTGKMIYARMVTFVERQSAPDEPIVTDLWWLDQIAASLSNTRTFLYASQPDERQSLIASFDRAGTPRVVLISSSSESVSSPESWFAGTCYVASRTASIADRHLTAVHVHRDCSLR
jgi:hypothetical protein